VSYIVFRTDAPSNHLVYVETKLVEMKVPEGKVLENFNAVSNAQRLAKMVGHLEVGCSCDLTRVMQELRDSDFGKREEVQRLKRVARRRGGDQ
jgi:ATP-dependent RNA helicase DDX49/DBP8